MKRTIPALFLFGMAAFVTGCAAKSMYMSSDAVMAMPRESHAESRVESRMLIWRASISLEVATVSNAVARVSEIAQRSGGYIEGQSDSGQKSARVTIRVPASALSSAMGSLESIGKVRSRHVSSDDVTEKYVDTDARLKTMLALRDRLEALLDKARDVKEILAIEKELGRIQSDIDSMQARLKALKGKADLATINVSIQRRRILGPLGYVLKGVGWGIRKLFVIQE